MMTDDDARRQGKTLQPTSTSLSTLPFNNISLTTVNTKRNPSGGRPSSASSARPPVPPRNPARSRRPATTGDGGVTGQSDELSAFLSDVPHTTAFSVTTGSYVAGYGPKPPKIASKAPKAESSGGRSDGTRPRSMTWQRRSSHDHDLTRTRQSHNPVLWTSSSPATSATPSTSSKRRPTTTSGVITTHKQTNFTGTERWDLKSSALQASTMTKPYFVTKNGKKHHSFSSKRAPYPRNYERESLDHDGWNHLFFTRLCDSPTFHQFTQPPKRVLDLGCGHGHWVVDAAQQWPETEFVGLDLVPIQPDLKRLASGLQSRITWVVANFLERLPFSDDHFDLVEIRRVARGVPEDKWASVFEEVSRVLKPDGAIELIEEELLFPGGSEPCNCHHTSGSDTDETPVGSPVLLAGPSASLEGLPKNGLASPSLFFHSAPESTPKDPHDHSALEAAYNDMHAARFINLSPVSLLANILVQYFKDVRSHPPVLVTFPPPETELNSAPMTHPPPRPLSRNSACSSATGSMGSSAACSSPNNSPPPSAHPLRNSTAAPSLNGWSSIRVNLRSLISPNQPFVMIDRCRMPARTVGQHSMSQLPNTKFDFDLHSLTLHLSQTVVDVLGCTESIWEYLRRKDKKLERSEFDSWVRAYENDMRQRIGLAAALRERFSWDVRDLVNGSEQPVHHSTLLSPTTAMLSLITADRFTHSANNSPYPPLTASPQPVATDEGKRVNTGEVLNASGEGESNECRPRSKSEPMEHTQAGAESDSRAHHRPSSVQLEWPTVRTAIRDASGVGGEEQQQQQQQQQRVDRTVSELSKLSRCVKVFVAWNSK